MPKRMIKKDNGRNEILPEEVENGLRWFEEFGRERMLGEFRKDPEFRALITQTEIGDLIKYITHDPILNPSARPHGSREDEILAYGQAFVQLIGLACVRGVPLDEAFRAGVENWLDRDWKKKESLGNGEFLKGFSAYSGQVEGETYLITEENPLCAFPGDLVLVTEVLKPNMAAFLRENRPLAIITDHGGRLSHAAIITREYEIISVVGTGEASKRIVHGSKVRVEAAESGEGKVFLIP